MFSPCRVVHANHLESCG